MTELSREPIAGVIGSNVEGGQFESSNQAGSVQNQYFFATYGSPADNSSLGGVTFSGSSPWWAARLVAPPAGGFHVISAPGEAPEPTTVVEKSGDAIVRIVRIESQSPAINVYDQGPVTFNDPRLDLDLGPGVIVASGAVTAPARTHAIERVAWQGFLTTREGFELEWFAPDPSTVPDATILDDAEWDEDEPAPTWISLADVSYRGGGVMGRRRGSTRGPAGV